MNIQKRKVFQNDFDCIQQQTLRFTYMYYNMFVLLKTEVMVVETLVIQRPA